MTQKVPLIFICHGIGGLIFKQAFLNLCRSRRASAACVRFVVFLGTPHYGCHNLSLCIQPEDDRLDDPSMSKLSSWVIKQTARNSAYVLQLNNSYRVLATGIPTRCYTEALPIATCREPNERIFFSGRNIAVPERDSQICRFAQWNNFKDEFQSKLEATHFSIVTCIGSAKHYLSLLMKIRDILSDESLAQLQRNQDSLTDILARTSVQCYSFQTVPLDSPLPLSFPESVLQFPLGGRLNTAHGLQTDRTSFKALSLKDLIRRAFSGYDFPPWGTDSDRKELNIPGAHRDDWVDWYHVRHCVGDWVPLLQSAIYQAKDMAPTSDESLTADLWHGFFRKFNLRRLTWQYPSPSFQPYSMRFVDTGDTSIQEGRRFSLALALYFPFM